MKKSVTIPKKKLIGALMLAKHAGMQQGAQAAAAQAGPPPGMPPAPGGGAPMPPPGGGPGMKAGGFVPFGKKGEKAEGESKAMDKKEGAAGEKKEKWVPPWAKKKAGGIVKMASGGMVGGRGDGCATRGKTRGRMV